MNWLTCSFLCLAFICSIFFAPFSLSRLSLSNVWPSGMLTSADHYFGFWETVALSLRKIRFALSLSFSFWALDLTFIFSRDSGLASILFSSAAFYRFISGSMDIYDPSALAKWGDTFLARCSSEMAECPSIDLTMEDLSKVSTSRGFLALGTCFILSSSFAGGRVFFVVFFCTSVWSSSRFSVLDLNFYYRFVGSLRSSMPSFSTKELLLFRSAMILLIALVGALWLMYSL